MVTAINVIVHSKTIKLTGAIREFCQDQVSKLFGKGSRISQITFLLEDISRKKNHKRRATAKVKIAIPGKDVVIKRQAHDLYKAIVDVTSRASRKLRKTKEKRKGKLVSPQVLDVALPVIDETQLAY